VGRVFESRTAYHLLNHAGATWQIDICSGERCAHGFFWGGGMIPAA
jgi:hypothetical protein